MNFVINPQNLLVKPLLVLLMLVKGSCFAQVVVRFQDHITNHASRLGDVVVIDDDQYDWANLPLASQPIAGERLTKDTILAWMQNKLGQFDYRWQGKTQTQIHGVKQSSSSALIDLAKSALLKQLTPHYKRVKVSAISTPKDSDYPLDQFKAQVTINFPVAKRVCVWLITDQQRIAVWFRVRAYAQVFTTHHHLAANQLVTRADVTLQEQDIAGLNDMPAKTVDDNAWLTRALDADTVLLANHLSPPPVVLHGQTIKVSVQTNHLSIVMTAIALNDGYVGQTILVKNPVNQQSFSAVVTGLQHARVSV